MLPWKQLPFKNHSEIMFSISAIQPRSQGCIRTIHELKMGLKIVRYPVIEVVCYQQTLFE